MFFKIFLDWFHYKKRISLFVCLFLFSFSAMSVDAKLCSSFFLKNTTLSETYSVLNKKIVGDQKLSLSFKEKDSSKFSPYSEKAGGELFLTEIRDTMRIILRDDLTFVLDDTGNIVLRKLHFEHSHNSNYIGLRDVHKPIKGKIRSEQIEFTFELRGNRDTNSKRYLTFSIPKNSLKNGDKALSVDIRVRESGDFIYKKRSYYYRALAEGKINFRVYD